NPYTRAPSPATTAAGDAPTSALSAPPPRTRGPRAGAHRCGPPSCLRGPRSEAHRQVLEAELVVGPARQWHCGPLGTGRDRGPSLREHAKRRGRFQAREPVAQACMDALAERQMSAPRLLGVERLGIVGIVGIAVRGGKQQADDPAGRYRLACDL